MSLFLKIFLSISISAIISITFFSKYIISIQKEYLLDKLSEKITLNEKTNKNNISKLLFDLNKEITNINLSSLYLDKDIVKIELIDFSNVMNITLDKKVLSKKLIKSQIPLDFQNEPLGELNIYYSKDEIYHEIELYENNIIKFSMFLGFLLLSIIFYFIRTFIKSIKELTNATSEISSGNLDFKIDINTNDEIGILADKFNIMKNSLQNRLHIIHQQLKFQQSLMQSVNIPIYIIDKDNIFIDCNNAFAQFYGKKRENIIGESIDFLVRGEYLEKAKKINNELFKEGSLKTYITKLPNFKKELRDLVLYKNVYVDEPSNLKWIIGTYFDITEINQAKEKIEKFNQELQQKVYERTEELEESNEELQSTISNLKQTQEKLIESEKLASLGSLVAGVAHEINTPIGIGITSISHFLEINDEIKQAYEKEVMSEDDFEQYLNTSLELGKLIESNLKRTAYLIKTFKQISVDQTNEEKRVFNLKNYIDDILFSISNITKKESVLLDILIDEKLEINTYAGALSQIITNLILNSVNHGFKNITNEKNVKLVIQKTENKLEIIYTDNGKGISKENLPKIFDPFFTTNRMQGNTGLGLNIIYNIIKNNFNGSIICESEEGNGVKFTINMII